MINLWYMINFTIFYNVITLFKPFKLSWQKQVRLEDLCFPDFANANSTLDNRTLLCLKSTCLWHRYWQTELLLSFFSFFFAREKCFLMWPDLLHLHFTGLIRISLVDVCVFLWSSFLKTAPHESQVTLGLFKKRITNRNNKRWNAWTSKTFISTCWLADVIFYHCSIRVQSEREGTICAHSKEHTPQQSSRSSGKTRDRLVVMNTDRRWLSSIVSL